MPKERTRKQELEDMSEAKLKQLLSGWVVNKLDKDFGIDFDVRMTESNVKDSGNQIVTGDHFSLQLKSTDDDCKNGFFEDLEMVDWNLFLENSTPVILAKYYSKCDLIMYEVIQPYAWNILDRKESKWKDGTQKRIHLSKKIDNLEVLKRDIHEAFIQIVRKRNYYNTSIGEGINPSDFDKLRDKDLQEFKFKTLMVAFSEINSGNEEKGIELLEEVYSCPREDVLKFVANINLILHLNSLNPHNHNRIVKYSEEGIKLSERTGDNVFKDFLAITIHNVALVRLITKMSQMLYAKRISNMSGGDFVPFYDIEISQLYQIQDRINRNIQTLIENQLKSNNLYGLALSLSTLIETVVYQVERFSIVNDNLLEIEAKHRRPFIEGYEKLISIIKDESIIQFGYYLLARYYFYMCDYQKAEGYISKAIEISERLGCRSSEDWYDRLLDDTRNKKSPFDPNNQTKMNIEEMTFAQYRDILQKSLELQGIKTSVSEGDSAHSDYIQIALEDADPSEFMKYCENMRIEYLGTSMLGHNIGLFSLGPKIIWCANSGALEGVSLERLHQGFVEGRCKNCALRKERPQDWVCTIKSFQEMNSIPQFQEFLKNLRSK